MQSLLYQYSEVNDQIKGQIEEDLYSELKDICQEFSQSIQTQRTSSSLLLMNVEDILGFAQIKAGKFTKHTSSFNIRKAIDDIMGI